MSEYKTAVCFNKPPFSTYFERESCSLSHISEYFSLLSKIEDNSRFDLTPYIIRFKASLIANFPKFGDDLCKYSISDMLVTLMEKSESFCFVYHVLCASIAWTSCDTVDIQPFCTDIVMTKLFNWTIKCLSGIRDRDEIDFGIASLTLIQNLVYGSLESAQCLVRLKGLDILSALFHEAKVEKIKNTISLVFNNVLRHKEIPLSESHFILDTYVPFFGYSLIDFKVSYMSNIHFFCCYSVEYARYFFSVISINNFFSNYITSRKDVRTEMLCLISDLLKCPDYKIKTESTKIPWNSIVYTIEKDGGSNEITALCDLFVVFFHEGGEYVSSLYETNIFQLLLTLLEQSKVSIRKKVLNTCLLLFETSSHSMINVLSHSGITTRLTDFLYCDWPELIQWSLRMLIQIIDFAMKTTKARNVMEELSQFEYQDIDNPIILEDQEFSIPELYDNFVIKANELVDYLSWIHNLDECAEPSIDNSDDFENVTQNNLKEYPVTTEKPNIKPYIHSEEEEIFIDISD